MQIECKLKRPGGTKVTIATTEYHFAPLEDGAHVADVEIEAHADRFLSISDAYKLYRGKLEAPKGATVQVSQPLPVIEDNDAKDAPALYGSNAHPANFDINGKTITLGEVVALAHAASGLSNEEWNDLSDDTRADLIDEELDKLAADKNGDGTVDEKEERAALAAKYEAKFGKKPHYNLSLAKLREQVGA